MKIGLIDVDGQTRCGYSNYATLPILSHEKDLNVKNI